MATVITINTGQSGYREVLDQVVNYGLQRAPRGLETLDLGHTTVIIRDPRNALPIGCGRKLSTKVAAVEALQLIAMEMYEDLVLKASPNFSRYIEPAGYFHGAYGRRLAVNAQLDYVAEKLRLDPFTRQAVATIWDPQLDNLSGRRDYPCTVAMGFAIREDQLEMYTTMRSNDAFLGFPYDIFNFTQLQLTLARALDVEPGPYTHTAWSLHVYTEDLDAIEEVFSPGPTAQEVFQPEGVGRAEDRFPACRTRANALLTSREPNLEFGIDFEFTRSEEWYGDQLAPLLG